LTRVHRVLRHERRLVDDDGQMTTAATSEGNNPVLGYVGATLNSTTALYVQVYPPVGTLDTRQPDNVIVTCN
jgi:hypothetical protein